MMQFLSWPLDASTNWSEWEKPETTLQKYKLGIFSKVPKSNDCLSGNDEQSLQEDIKAQDCQIFGY